MRINESPSRMVLAVLLAGALSPSTLSAARISAAPDSIIELEVQVEGGQPFQVSLWAGQEAFLRSQRHDLALEIIPDVVEATAGLVTLRVGRTLGNGLRGGLLASEALEVPVQVGFPQPLAYFPVEVRVLEIRKPTLVERLAAEQRRSRASLDTKAKFPKDDIIPRMVCCVTCGGDTLCGCRVSAGCGSCCDDCCGGFAK